MKHIDKGAEPRSLTEHRMRQHADYDNYSYADKDELRRALLSEQGRICCYCMQRISEETCKIEHWASQDGHEDRQLEYSNLLAACPGGEGYSTHLQHCDTRKAEQDITINPADRLHNCENMIRYQPDGEIYSEQENINNDLNVTLNLNLQTLKSNRKNALDGAIEGLTRAKPDGAWSRAFLENAKNEWQARAADNSFKPYCTIVVAYIDKKLNRL